MQRETDQPNRGPTTDLPHPLLRAFERLESALDEGIDQFKRNRNFSNAADVCSATERFVDEFCRVPAWEAELRKRTVFVEKQCTQGSAFRRAMDTALRRYRSQPKKAVGSGISGPRLAIQELRRIGAGLWLADEVLRVRQTLERAITEGIFTANVVPDFQQWLQECRKIQHEAERTEADGCYFLSHVHLAVQANPPDRSVCVKAIIDTGTIGGWKLVSLLAGAESLISWALENRPVEPVKVEEPPATTTAKFGTVADSGDIPYLFRRSCDFWQVQFQDESGNFRAINGMTYIAQLLANPHQKMSAFNLKRATAEDDEISIRQQSPEVLANELSMTTETMQDVSDEESVRACLIRLADIDEEQDSAREAGGIGKLDELEDEKHKIQRFLSTIKNIRGDFRPLGDKQRSVFNSVKQAIQRAIKIMKTANSPMPNLAEHFDKYLEWGDGAFEYRPNSTTPDWHF